MAIRSGRKGGDLPLSSSEGTRLKVLETRIRAGLRTFLEVGSALMEIRDTRLYRHSHDTFEGYCRERWGMGRRNAYQLIDAAIVVENVRNCAHYGPTEGMALPANEAQARALKTLPLHEQGELWLRALETAPGGNVTAAHVKAVVESHRSTSLDVHYSSRGDEWYTPPHVIDAVVACLGRIDLDPCSNSHSEPVVPARRHFTVAEDGLSRPWAGRIYMNPPYGGEIGTWTTKLRSEFEAGRVSAAIALVPARTDTRWFRELGDHPRCFVHGRLSFSGHLNSAPFPSAAFYLGHDTHGFVETFAELGDTFVRLPAREG